MRFNVKYIYGCHYAAECVYPNCTKCFFNGCGYVCDNDYFSYFDDEYYDDEYYDLATEIQLQNGDKPFYSEYDGGFIL